MRNYLDLLRQILDRGEERSDRTGVGTLSLFGEQLRFDLSQSFPIMTTKKLHWHSIRTELLWMLRGKTNVRWLQERGVKIWDEWADPQTGELGPVYGSLWRRWEENTVNLYGIDQLRMLVNSLQSNPTGRRHIITAWNPTDVPHCRLPPCHCFMQFYVREHPGFRRSLDCQMYQRSADVFLGVPYNIASYALLTNLIAMEVGMGVGDLVICFGDVHIYKNHVEQVKLQLSREPRAEPVSLGVHFKKGALLALDDQPGYEPEDFSLVNYSPWPAIKAEVAV